MANSTDAYDIIIRHCRKPLKLFPFALKQIWCLYQTLSSLLILNFKNLKLSYRGWLVSPFGIILSWDGQLTLFTLSLLWCIPALIRKNPKLLFSLSLDFQVYPDFIGTKKISCNMYYQYYLEYYFEYYYSILLYSNTVQKSSVGAMWT